MSQPETEDDEEQPDEEQGGYRFGKEQCPEEGRGDGAEREEYGDTGRRGVT